MAIKSSNSNTEGFSRSNRITTSDNNDDGQRVLKRNTSPQPATVEKVSQSGWGEVKEEMQTILLSVIMVLTNPNTLVLFPT